MKNLLRILGITFLSMLYCTAISSSGNISKNSYYLNKTDREKVKSDLTVSIKQFSNTAQAESLGNNFTNSLPTTIKESNKGFFAIVKIRERFFANAFSQYIFKAKNFLIKYGKANIIFPFHYFW